MADFIFGKQGVLYKKRPAARTACAWLFDAQAEEGEVVVGFGTVTVLLYGFLDGFNHVFGTLVQQGFAEGQQALIDYLQTWLTIYEEKFKEAIAMMQSDFNNSDCAGLAKHGSWVQH